MLKDLAFDKDFKLSKFSAVDYYSSLIINTEVKEDTSIVLSKYEKIKKSHAAKALIEEKPNLNHGYFSITDIMSDTNVISTYNMFKKEFDLREELKIKFANLSVKERKKIKREIEEKELYCGFDGIIVVEPMVFSFEKTAQPRKRASKTR